MIFITGDTRSQKLIKVLQQHGMGRMVIDKAIRPYHGEPWGFDNGAYRDWLSGNDFDGDAFETRLETALSLGAPYLAVVPDIVAGGEKSLIFSLSWLDRLPKEWPWYLAVQDGMKLDQVQSIIHPFTGIFLGGTDKFKATAWYWCKLAHQHGKRFHYGRAGTPRKILHARLVGSDSCDSAFPLWSFDRFKRLLTEWEGNSEQIEFWDAEVWSVAP
jgi:hypothetical protein